MCRFGLFILLLVTVPRAVTSQDLPPEVLLLARIKAYMADKFERLPDYTCLETVRRFHKPAGVAGKMKPLDTVRLEILYSQHRDLYASPGERQFRDAAASSFTGGGMMASGFFTLQLKTILSGNGKITYHGREDLDGRPAVRYDFHLNHLERGYIVDVTDAKGRVGIQGSFWADPQTLEVLRMEDRVDDIPPYLPLEESTDSVTYAPMRIGGREELLPQSAELYLRKTSGEENSDFFELTYCGSFRTESAIHFDTDVVRPSATPTAGGSALPAVPMNEERAVPPFLLVTLQLVTPVTERDAVGTLIEARVSADVRHKGGVIIPRGSPVRGRIRRLERSMEADLTAYFIVGLEFTEIQVNGSSLRFYADLLKFAHAPEIEPALSHRRFGSGIGARNTPATETITLPELTGVASFFVRCRTLKLPQAFQMVWRTRGLLR